MKKRYSLLSFTLLLLLVCLGNLTVLDANGITFEMAETDRSKLPKGPNPKNEDTYDPTKAETFTFNFTGLADNEYYRVSASLTRSNFKGYAANFPTDSDGRYKDLEFLKSDYVRTTTVKGKEVITYLRGWVWNSDTSLSFETDTTNNAKPGSIIVRCHDWGANGTLTVTIQRKTGIDPMGNDLWEKCRRTFHKADPL